MNFTPVVSPGRLLVRSYGTGGFNINDHRVVGSVMLFPSHVETWEVHSVADLPSAEFLQVIEERPQIEVLLVGTGHSSSALDTVSRENLRTAGICVDVMPTGAACRTYNVLVGEDRRVAAALIALG